MSTFKNKNSLRTIELEAQIVQKLKNNEARPNLLVLIEKEKRVHAEQFNHFMQKSDVH